MTLKNSTILLTVFLRGRLGAANPRKVDKDLLSKIKRSPFETSVLNRKGIPTGRYKTPKNHFKAPNDFEPREVTQCKRVTTLSEDCVNYFISENSKPFHYGKRAWQKMTEKQRLEANLAINADGNEFIYTIVES